MNGQPNPNTDSPPKRTCPKGGMPLMFTCSYCNREWFVPLPTTDPDEFNAAMERITGPEPIFGQPTNLCLDCKLKIAWKVLSRADIFVPDRPAPAHPQEAACEAGPRRRSRLRLRRPSASSAGDQ
jgi:hypothetical protein